MPLPRESELFFGLAATMTDEQRAYVDSIFDYQLTMVNAKSGTGKTTLAVGCAKIISEQVRTDPKLRGTKRKLYYVYSPVEESTMGFRPGNTKEKGEDYLQPLKDALREIGEDPESAIFDPYDPQAWKHDKAWVIAIPHVFARGMNMKDSTVMIVEAQNFTRGELKKVFTRIHDDCTVIVEGHDGQCDLKDPRKSGFVAYINHFRDMSYANVVKLHKNFRGQLAQDADELSW